MNRRDAPFLLARVHRPLEHTISVLYRRLGDNVGVLDGRLFVSHTVGEPIKAYAWWQTTAPEVIGRGNSGRT